MPPSRKKWKRGDIRGDGMVFWAYSKNSIEGCHWVTKEKFEEKKRKLVENMRLWRKKNPEKPKEQCRKWREKNREEHRRRAREWSKNNPEKRKVIMNKCTSKRRALQNKIYIELDSLKKEFIHQIYEMSVRISKCLGIKHHVDHIIPIEKGGHHSPDNLRVLPAYWNRVKGSSLNFNPWDQTSNN